MSQQIDHETALSLKKGDRLYHNIIEFTRSDGTTYPASAVVVGKVQEDMIERWKLPIRHEYGDRRISSVSSFNPAHWRTTPEKIVPTHIRRTRAAVQQALPLEEPPVEEESRHVVGRVRRQRH